MKLWARIKGKKTPEKPSSGEMQYVLTVLRAHGTILHEIRQTQNDMNARLVAVEQR